MDFVLVLLGMVMGACIAMFFEGGERLRRFLYSGCAYDRSCGHIEEVRRSAEKGWGMAREEQKLKELCRSEKERLAGALAEHQKTIRVGQAIIKDQKAVIDRCGRMLN